MHYSEEDAQGVIIGAGPAGLSAAYEFTRLNRKCVVLEADAQAGGLSRTVEYNGCRFDIGGHRFFTKVAAIDRLWHDTLGAEFLERPRLSRIYFRSRYFQYPLEPFDALRKLGVMEALRCVASYCAAHARPKKPEPDLETWLVNRFGSRLYEMFFASYTEKVWGMPCSQIKAEWAAQRIRGLSMVSLVANALTPKLLRRGTPKTLIERFRYPRLGPGQMWDQMAERVTSAGGRVIYREPVQKIHWSADGVTSVTTPGGIYRGSSYLSSMPIRHLVRALDPAPPEAVAAAAEGLRYRDFITVALIVRAQNLFPDNWIYVHDPRTRVGRIQNYKNWSPALVSDPELTCLGFEYFCSRGDSLWEMTDEQLRHLAAEELGKLGLGNPADVIDAAVVRVPKAYPVYDDEYQAHLATIREFLGGLPNLQLIGRNGMHRYNNQDHSMLSGILGARNAMGMGNSDLWNVNAEPEYHEDGFSLSQDEAAGLERSQPLVPAAMKVS